MASHATPKRWRKVRDHDKPRLVGVAIPIYFHYVGIIPLCRVKIPPATHVFCQPFIGAKTAHLVVGLKLLEVHQKLNSLLETSQPRNFSVLVVFENKGKLGCPGTEVRIPMVKWRSDQWVISPTYCRKC